jgi:hypothetical protein
MGTRSRLSHLALLATLWPATSFAADQAGVAAAVRGQITMAREQVVGQAVQSGAPILMQDAITSGPRSGMQILLLDETTFTIGPDSELVVDDFVYDPKTGAGQLSARVAKGVFRFVTGRIAKEQPSKMNVALPAGTIGIRGTMVAGRANPGTKSSVAILLGEGADNAGGDPSGVIDVCNVGQCTTVSRAGYGVRIDGEDSAPSPAFRVETAELDQILRAVTSPEVALDDAVGDASDEDVENVVAEGAAIDDGAKRAKDAHKHLQKIADLDSLTVFAAQDARDEESFRMADMASQAIADGQSTYQQLRTVPSGQIYYQQLGTSLTNGSYDLFLNVDFGAQTFGGGNSRVQVNSSIFLLGSGTAPLPTVSYSSSSGPAQYQQGGLMFLSGTSCGGTCVANLVVKPQNQGGVVGANAQHQLNVNDAGGIPIDSGSGTAPSLPGLAP